MKENFIHRSVHIKINDEKLYKIFQHSLPKPFILFFTSYIIQKRHHYISIYKSIYKDMIFYIIHTIY